MVKHRNTISQFFIFIFTILAFPKAFSASPPASIYHVAPSHWYTGFKDSILEIIIHTENADLLEFELEDYKDVQFVGKTNSANRHVAYLHLIIKPSALPGLLYFAAKPISRRVRYVKPFKFTYQLQQRAATIASIQPSDILYRIILDRFSNGNEKNDRTALKNPYEFNRKDPAARHGGDLDGFINNLDYFKDLGITSLWVNQLQENDTKESSFLGKAITNHYAVDPRYGDNGDLAILKEALAVRKLKLTMDLNLNQVGWFHWMHLNFDTGWFNNPDSSIFPLPDADYLNYPGLSITEKKWISSHWMDPSIPDLNQNNPHIARYLKQFCLWWTEQAGISAWMIPDPHLVDPEFLEQFKNQVALEYPGIELIVNTKTNSFLSQAKFVENSISKKSSLTFDGITDYSLQKSLQKIAASDTCDRRNWNDLFNLLEMSSIYKQENSNIIFMDDIAGTRSFELCKTNTQRLQMIQSLFYCLPGTPSLLYGSEIELLDQNFKGNPLPNYPSCDQKNILNCLKQMNASEKSAYTFSKNCIALRTENPTLINGELTLYAPSDGLFSFFRFDNNHKIFVVVNDSPMERMVLTKRYQQEFNGYNGIKNLFTSENSLLSDFLIVPSHSTLIYELVP